ncbi:MAG: methionine adenosyltransferase [Omnitrophica WOR_2 bacterium GWF2_38_59]|nr:MAG: methionine adenosyltransferase [Omnitrophica WOR_2 bacterium GWA2_37_7]OGX23852.1 MAG: methionine adenosyltransferase [Omnitrophica WOR_2 bacterium GWF2_38_59]OGX47794.1 MAG: methionine adenosyltransferase [Omnitrophica WOR_2 bacterium RIFOXYA2_FULL_38_17]OGX56045.1 MAG: methionine adenosyltransferase [Omnitrophica WOR_2 bacterium RIFOXYB2_FULL_38_16]OGX56949.1 MAG: methionine adenosyltransferase [Omnitrophica WOR_2 bacterium RIFOXYC2_FULL_38_12]HBG60322.1 methionine adenosyltransferas
MKGKYFITSESVGAGHPDKVCDQISDAVLDACLKDDPLSRVACETFISSGLVVVGGEITTKTYIDVHKLVRKVVKDIGYDHPKYGFDANTCAILNGINSQSPDISQGVDAGGAGDQGIMYGYATDETPELMPLPIMLAHKLVLRIAELRVNKVLKYLGPDCKSQVTVEYLDDKPIRVDTVVLACQHTEDILDKTGKRITKKAREEMINMIAKPIVGKLMDSKTKFFVNETGKFVVGGPQSDAGVTGRKIIVDNYGGIVPHGGGAFSGKDSTKVDRSATYMARYITKNIVAAKLAKKCLVQLSYAIGYPEPLSIYVDTFGTGIVDEAKLEKIIRKHFDLTPKGIIKTLDLRKPKFLKTASYGHFGRNEKEFTWEKTDKAAGLKKDALRK